MMSPSHLTTQDQVKCIATLCGDSISHAVSNSKFFLPKPTLKINMSPKEIQLKSRRQQNVVHRTSVTSDCSWKLQQVQDAANHLQQAIRMIENIHDDYKFKYSTTVLQ
jgi:protein rogdi